MNKLQEAFALTNKDFRKSIDTQSYSKIDQLRQLNLNPTPVHVAKDLLSARENPKEYAKQHKLEFKFRQTQVWQPTIKESQIKLPQQIQQQQELIDTTNAISFIETSKTEESQVVQSSQSTRRKILVKSRQSKQSNDSLVWKKPLKQINKVVLQLKSDSKIEYSIVIKYEDASNQLEARKIDNNKRIQWDCQIKFEVTEEPNLYLIIVQQDKKNQQNVLQQIINLQTIEKEFTQEVQLKYLKSTINATLYVEFN